MDNLICSICLKPHTEEQCKKEDLVSALEYYQDKRFMHQMKDGWIYTDFEQDDYYYRKIQDLTRRIKECENGN